jgi:hypothetical protein
MVFFVFCANFGPHDERTYLLYPKGDRIYFTISNM